MRREFVVYVLAGFGLGALIYFITQGGEYRERVYAVSECVSERWAEYEEITGSMPSVEIEKEWYKSCSILVRSQ